MPSKPNVYKKAKTKKTRLFLGVAFFSLLVVMVMIRCVFLSDKSGKTPSNISSTVLIPSVEAPAVSETKSSDTNEKQTRYDGPILYHTKELKPLHLILVEKDLQRLSLYRYNGNYQLVKSYRCVTGKQRGDKERENDDKTPEGIYFNVKTYRDDEITIFGDRAFGLNYPDVFDEFEGKGGSGIFIHGTNRDVNPYSTNGCLVLENEDLADLDKHIQFEQTPIIIGKRLPYRFSTTQRDFSDIVPIIRQAMLPKDHAAATADYDQFLILGYPNQIVAMSRIRIDKGIEGISRVYLADSGKQLLVLLKRQWQPERKMVVATAKTTPQQRVKEPDSTDESIKQIVESWRRSWEQEKINEYISFYHSAFIGNGRNIAEWKQYKQNLNRRYKRISVSIANLKIVTEKNIARAYFHQQYQTESYGAEGYKCLEFKKEDNTWKIFREKSYPSKPRDWPA